jgi:hypothetical protein
MGPTAYIGFAEESHPNFLIFLGIEIADCPSAQGTSPRELGRKWLQGGHATPTLLP